MKIKRGFIDFYDYFREIFKPIIDPLNTIAQNDNTNNPTMMNNQEEVDNDLLTTPHQFKMYDKACGIYYGASDDKLKIGKVTVNFYDGKIYIGDKIFSWTSGLQSLLCDKNLNGTSFEDIEAYYEKLKHTKVHF